MNQDKKETLFAAMLYFSILALLLNLPYQLILICCLLIVIAVIGIVVTYVPELLKGIKEKKRKERHLAREILWYLPIWIGSVIFSALFMKNGANARAVGSYFDSILGGGALVLTAPIFEEFFFRFIPRRFMRNDIAYILISSIVFAWVHVVGDPYFWNMIFYIIRPVYYSYRYVKTDDIVVPFVLHEFGNTFSLLLHLL